MHNIRTDLGRRRDPSRYHRLWQETPDALDENAVADVASVENDAAIAAADPQEICASSTTYDRIKLELFRQAVELRGRDKAAFDRIANYSFVRMDLPTLRGRDEASGEVTCTGRLTLDLPPGLAVAGGANRLGAEVGYIVRPSAGGGGEVVSVAGADPIIVPLATLARTAAPSARRAGAGRPARSTARPASACAADSARPDRSAELRLRPGSHP